MDKIELLGWLSSFILLATILKQIHKQLKNGSSAGVSKWLYLGNMISSTGFTIYSLLIRNWVFAVTNFLLFLSNIFGLAIVVYHRYINAQPREL